VPHGNWKTITFIAVLRHDRVTAPFVLEGPMTGEMFKAYTEQLLAPTLTRGNIVFMDNVSVHKVDGGIREMHWHKEAEWAYMLAGRARITAIDTQGRNFIDDVSAGD
jgi:hypothetical protein